LYRCLAELVIKLDSHLSEAAKEVLHEGAEITSSAIMTGVHIAAKVTGAARRIASQILGMIYVFLYDLP
jgi:hypothetical protein